MIAYADSTRIPEPPPRRRWLTAAALMFGGWTLVGLFGIAQSYFTARLSGTPEPDPDRWKWTLESVWLWALFTPAIFWVAWRGPLERGKGGRNTLVHVAAALAIAAVDVVFDYLFEPLIGEMAVRSFAARFAGKSFINVFSYAALVGIAHAVRYARVAAERRVREAALERELLQARLQALEAQLHPHFLFNTLHTVASLVRIGEGQGAIRMLTGLGDLLRLALRPRDAQEVPLAEELDFVGRYLEVEGVRFQDRLRTAVDVAPDVPADALVPHMILQPLVENAIRHGVESSASAGCVSIRVHREGGMLHLTVRDDGPGPNGGKEKGGRGIGLGNTRARLRHLYGDRHRCELAAGEESGAVATIAVPFHRAEGARG